MGRLAEAGLVGWTPIKGIDGRVTVIPWGGTRGRPRDKTIRWSRIIKRLGAKKRAPRMCGDKPKQAPSSHSDEGD